MVEALFSAAVAEPRNAEAYQVIVRGVLEAAVALKDLDNDDGAAAAGRAIAAIASGDSDALCKGSSPFDQEAVRTSIFEVFRKCREISSTRYIY